jgi:hypothetical protein
MYQSMDWIIWQSQRRDSKSSEINLGEIKLRTLRRETQVLGVIIKLAWYARKARIGEIRGFE